MLNVADETELSQMTFEFPFNLFSTIDARPIVDGDEALERLTQTINEMLAQMQPQG